MANNMNEPKINIPTIKNSTRSDTFVVVFLDALLDTRIGVIGETNPELAGKILSSGKYFNREFDEFDGLSNSQFKELYAKRNADTLPHCVVTNVSYFLQRLVKDALMADALAPNDDRLIVHLNVWPYSDLTNEELDCFRDAVRFYTYSYAEIVVINKPISAFTPQHCKENYDIIIMYDYEQFIDTHSAELEKNQIPGVSLVGPAMYRSGMPVGEDAVEIKKLQMNPYNAVELAMAPVVGLKLMPVSLFCITDRINPDNKELILDAVRYTEEELTQLVNASKGIKNVMDMDLAPNLKEEIAKPLEDDML